MLLSIVFEVMLAEGITSNPFLFNDYKKAHYNFSLEFLQQCLLVQGLRPGLAS